MVGHIRGCLQVLTVTAVVAAVLAPSTAFSADPRRPFPQNVEYVEGSLSPNHRSLEQLNGEVSSAYWRWKSRYVARAGSEPDGHPRYRVRMGTAPSDATVSEGQGFGMLIVALMAGEDEDAQVVFDGMWEFFNDHRSEIDRRLMDWYVPADEGGEPEGDDSAFDGDCDIAYALLLADEQWGSSGRVDYRAQFEDVVAGVLESTIGPASRLPMLGDWVNPEGETYNQYTPRSSDFMPDHLRAFRSATHDPAWDEVLAAVQDVVDSLQTRVSPVTGLLPDFIVHAGEAAFDPQPAPPEFLEGPHDGHYYYNAGRDPWRIASDALLSGDPRSASQARRISEWIRTATGGVAQSIKAGYTLDGQVIGDYFTTFFAAPFGVAAMLDPAAQEWLNAVYDAVRDLQEDYYEDTVTLLSMLVMTRNYWVPTPERARVRIGAGPRLSPESS